jgi:hypothetical protein
MRTNDRGIAVPGPADKLPWSCDPERIEKWIAIADAEGVLLGYEGVTAEFAVLAANYHERMADIVRRLEAWNGAQDTSEDGLWDIVNDATALWAEYQEAVK